MNSNSNTKNATCINTNQRTECLLILQSNLISQFYVVFNNSTIGKEKNDLIHVY